MTAATRAQGSQLSAALWRVKPLWLNTRIKRPARYGFISSIYGKVRARRFQGCSETRCENAGSARCDPTGWGRACSGTGVSFWCDGAPGGLLSCLLGAGGGAGNRAGAALSLSPAPTPARASSGCTARPSPEPGWEEESQHPLPREQEREWQQVWVLGPSPAVRTCGSSTDIHPELRLQRRVFKEGAGS